MKNHGKLVGVLNRTNSVCEVYYDAKTQRVQECKHLSRNRTKWYEYGLEEYLDKPLNYVLKEEFVNLIP